jgi:putative RecB family exonuclease
MKKKIDYSKIYSPSKLNMFFKCPKSYHFYYLDPIYSQVKNELKRLPENIWSFHTLGKAVHNAITLFYHSPPEQRTKQQLKEYLKESWRSEVRWSEKPPLGKWGGFKTIDEERDSYHQAILMLKKFLKLAEVEPQVEYLPTKDFKHSIEDYINLITPLGKDFSISGKFDLIVKDNGFLHIIDFKTGRGEDDNNFQLRFYKVLAEVNFQRLVRRASFYFLRDGNKKEFDLEKEETEEIKEEIVEKIEKIRHTENFETRPSKLCKFCLFKTFCPEQEKVTEIVKEVSNEDYLDDLPF